MGPFIHDGGSMLKDEASSSQLVKEIESLVSARGLKVVEATTSVHQGSAAMTVVLFREDEEINTDDLAASYNLIYPRYSIILGERDLQLEVSSPGLQRNLKDVMEFSVFRGKDVRCYSVSRSAYAVGRIESADDSSVTLADAYFEGEEEKGAITLPFSDIAKAKLEYRWEAGNA